MTQALSQWAMIRFSHGQQYWLSKRLMTDYLRRPYSFYLNRNSSDLAKSVLEETQQAVNGALLPALRLVIHGTTAVAIIVLLLLIRPWLALVTASVLGVVYGAIYLLARRWLERIGKIRLQANRARFAAAGRPLRAPRRFACWVGSGPTWTAISARPGSSPTNRPMSPCCPTCLSMR